MEDRYMTLAEATARALKQGGPDILSSPKRFLARVADMADPESDEMRVLVRLCSPELLGPFRGAVAIGGEVSLRAAETRVRAYLEDECRIESGSAAAVASGIAEGVTYCLSAETQGQPQQKPQARPQLMVQAAAPQQKRDTTLVVTPSLQREARSSVSVSTASSSDDTNRLPVVRAVPKSGADIHVDLEITEQEARDGAYLSVIYDIPSTGARDSCDVLIPAGTSDWSILTVPGMGDLDVGGGPRGDLYVFLHVVDDLDASDESSKDGSFSLSRRTALALAGGIFVLTGVSALAASLFRHTEDDGQDFAAGPADNDEPQQSESATIVAVDAGGRHTVGLRSDGTAVAVGDNYFGQRDVQDWSDLIAVSAGDDHTVGLRSDGTAVAVGESYYGQCAVQDWSDLVAISAGANHTVGLRSDGTAVAVGLDSDGQCSVHDWTDLVAVSAGGFSTVGLRSDGTVVSTGYDLSSWHDIVFVSAGPTGVAGLRSDGTAVAVGLDSYPLTSSNWSDLVAVSMGQSHIAGLHSDGTVVSAGSNVYGQCFVSDRVGNTAVSAGDYHTVVLCFDGTVLAAGKNDNGQCNVADW